MLGSTVDTYSASALRVALWTNFTQCLRDWVDSAPEVDSRPALLSSQPRTSSTSAVACFLLVLLVLTHLALCSRRLLSHRMVDASAPKQFFLENLDNSSVSPLYFAVFSAVGTLRQVIFWEPSTTKISSLSRAWRGAGSLGVPPPRLTFHQLVSLTRASLL